MSHLPKTLLLLLCLTLLLFTTMASAEEPVMDGLTQGDSAWEQAFDAALLKGRDAYNTEDLQGAEAAFRRAIQLMPERPAAYRNLARTLHWKGDFPQATAYYDHYLRLAPEAEDVDQIQRERRATASRSSGELWTLPGDQRMALRSLERELEDGRAITAGGGGAFGLYETLLRMGYAAPELATFRRQLEAKLVQEFEERLSTEDGFLPVLRAEGWRLQRERLEALQGLTRDEERRRLIARRLHLVEAVEDLLGGRYNRAAEKAARARAENPDLRFVGWYQVVALEQAREPARALTALDELLEQGHFDRDARRRIEVLRAQLLQQLGRSEEAAEVYRDVLMR